MVSVGIMLETVAIKTGKQIYYLKMKLLFFVSNIKFLLLQYA